MQQHTPLNLPGFTLIEFMVVISVLAILALVFIPGVSSAMRGSDVNATTNELIGGINLAKLEAIRRGYPVVICPATQNYSSCESSATPTWQYGVLIYQDNNSDGSYTNNYNVPELIKLIQFPTSGGVSISLTPAANSLGFDEKGNFSQNEVFCLSKSDYTQRITINTLGVATSCQIGTSACSIGCP